MAVLLFWTGWAAHQFSGWAAGLTGSLSVQLYSDSIKWIKPDQGPVDGLTGWTGQFGPVFKTLVFPFLLPFIVS